MQDTHLLWVQLFGSVVLVSSQKQPIPKIRMLCFVVINSGLINLFLCVRILF